MVSTMYVIGARASPDMTIDKAQRLCDKLRPYGVDTDDGDVFTFNLDGTISIHGLIYEQAVKVIRSLDKSGAMITSILTVDGDLVYDIEDGMRDTDSILDSFEQFDMDYPFEDEDDEDEDDSDIEDEDDEDEDDIEDEDDEDDE